MHVSDSKKEKKQEQKVVRLTINPATNIDILEIGGEPVLWDSCTRTFTQAEAKDLLAMTRSNMPVVLEVKESKDAK